MKGNSPNWRTLEMDYEREMRTRRKHMGWDWAEVDRNGVRTQF